MKAKLLLSFLIFLFSVVFDIWIINLIHKAGGISFCIVGRIYLVFSIYFKTFKLYKLNELFMLEVTELRN